MISLLFSTTVFLAAALLFIVEPMFARMMLPSLGGAPAVWNTAMLFYQVALLVGYGAAHGIGTRPSRRWQVMVQVALMTTPLLLLPLGMPAGWMPPTRGNPVPWMLILMAVTVGLPFVSVATISPLMQRWLAATSGRDAGNPYWLYAASNAGSIVGLLAYPVLIEPWLGLRQQAWWWMAGYAALAGLTAWCGVVLWRRGAEKTSNEESVEVTETISWRRRLWWMVLAFAPSSLMLSVTTYLSSDVAAVPMLWVLPLAVYLVTFIFVFARRPWVKVTWMRAALPWVVLPLTVIYGMRSQHLVLVGAWNLVLVFIGGMACHGALAADRPSVGRLTEFYWWMSLGGVLGGVFNVLVAPVLFSWVAEYPVSVALVCLLGLAAGSSREKFQKPVLDILWAVVIGVGAWTFGELMRFMPTESVSLAILLKLGVPAAVVLLFRNWPVRLGLCVAGLMIAAAWLPGEQERVLVAERTFFGVHRVRADVDGNYHRLVHGTTVHGVQSMEPSRRREPLGYYAQRGPAGHLFEAWRQMEWPLQKVGTVGLGAGALAAYAEPGEEWTFFEIDPVVERIARDAGCFTYLGDCRAALKVVLGDARLSLRKSEEKFNVLVLDAYSSDAIPLHLITREAMGVYLSRLRENGWLVIHYSNRHLDLEPVIAALARDAGLVCRVENQGWVTTENKACGQFPSHWAVLARKEVNLGRVLCDSRWKLPRERQGLRVWTDDYASILSAWGRAE